MSAFSYTIMCNFAHNQLFLRMKKPLKRITIAVVSALLLLLVAGSFFMTTYALKANSNRVEQQEDTWRIMSDRYPDLKWWFDSVRQHRVLNDTTIEMPSKYRAHAYYMRAPKPTTNTAIVVHGYKENALKMLHLAKMYSDWGYNVLLPDLYAHGLSEGEYIQMGWKDRLDVMRWSEVANDLFRSSTGNSQQVLHGVSMGAATVMCVSGEKTPSYVRCFVEDCGYTDVWSEFKSELKNQFSLPAFPLLYTSSWLTDLRWGWNFKEASPLEAVKKSTKPMLFIHGGNDSFVPTPMVYELYKAKKGVKKLLVVPNATHARSFAVANNDYKNTVKQFIEEQN